jgi:thioredoxin 1
MNAVVELTDANFESEVLDAGMPVLVDFWAPWCGPCRAVGPTIEGVAQAFQGRVKVGKLNVDEQPGVAAALRIQSIPTVAVFSGNRVPGQQMIVAKVGVQPRKEYEAMLERALAARVPVRGESR